MKDQEPVIIRHTPEQIKIHSYKMTWGTVEEIHIEGEPYLISHLHIDPGYAIPPHAHAEVIFEQPVDGDGWIFLDETEIRIVNGKINEEFVELTIEPGHEVGYGAELQGEGLHIVSFSTVSWKNLQEPLHE